jgi:hypothetical protein
VLALPPSESAIEFAQHEAPLHLTRFWVGWEAWSTPNERTNASAAFQYWYSQGPDGIGEHAGREWMEEDVLRADTPRNEACNVTKRKSSRHVFNQLTSRRKFYDYRYTKM